MLTVFTMLYVTYSLILIAYYFYKCRSITRLCQLNYKLKEYLIIYSKSVCIVRLNKKLTPLRM